MLIGFSLSFHAWLIAMASLLFGPPSALAVKHSDFRSCIQSGFCRRNRALAEAIVSRGAKAAWKAENVQLSEDGKVTFTLERLSMRLHGQLAIVADEVVRFRLDPVAAEEEKKFSARYRIPEGDVILAQESGSFEAVFGGSVDVGSEMPVATENEQNSEMSVATENEQSREMSVATENEQSSETRTNNTPIHKGPQAKVFRLPKSQLQVKLWQEPFSLQLVAAEDAEATVLLHLNSENLLHFETGKQFNLAEVANEISDAAGLWYEPHFRGRVDSRPKGPTSLAMDIAFPASQVLYGIPEHASSLALKTTRSKAGDRVLTKGDPYRLFNLDVFEYELDSPMALYGAVPIMLGHSTATQSKFRSVGVFWNNPSETWVDIYDEEGRSDKSSGHSSDNSKQTGQRFTHWMSESGSFEVFLMAGAGLKELQGKVKALTGPPQLPPTFAIGYHQCRWNYRSVEDVLEVQAEFDKHELPFDVIWLDIEHTDGKRYMTWNPRDFADPMNMQRQLADKGRKLVTIVDPHLKKDQNWPVYRELIAQDLAVKAADGKSAFEGKCWPGWSVWTDYSNPEARKWWSSLFSFDKYKNSTENLFIWNDMNEPSVFESPEITMPRDNVHYGGVEHRDLHNLYGRYQQESTFQGLIDRSHGRKRPFLLSRSFYAGSQRFGAVWTGDNAAKWDHLAASGPMLLSLGMVGYGFAGADVGGFFGNPTTDLLIRWYQAGAMQPFFRAHAHIDAQRREPYLFGPKVTESIRKALRLRYSLLPLWYTAFEEAHRTGVSPMRAMITEFPEDSAMLSVDDQWMVSSALLFKPITSPVSRAVSIKLPKMTTWYRYDSWELVQQAQVGSEFVLPSPAIDEMLLFIRAGSIIARKDIPRRSSTAMRFDPFTLVVAVDPAGKKAQGSLYIDDGETFEYQREGAEHFARIHFTATLDPEDSLLTLSVQSSGGGQFSLPSGGMKVAKVIIAHPGGVTQVKADISLETSNSFEIKL